MPDNKIDILKTFNHNLRLGYLKWCLHYGVNRSKLGPFLTWNYYSVPQML
jgi:hypothetical protein